MGNHNHFGRLGEQIAKDFLIQKGFKIHVCNYRYLKSEVDIIAQKGGILTIVEVKTRTGGFTEDITSIINKRKIDLLVKAADHYVQDNVLDVEVRFDVITVLKKDSEFTVEHLEDAFHHF